MIFNKYSNKFGTACNNRVFVRSATPFPFFETDNRFNAQFEKLVNAYWLLFPVEIWTRFKICAVDNIIYFAKLTDLAMHICDHYCVKILQTANFMVNYLFRIFNYSKKRFDSLKKECPANFPPFYRDF